MLRWLFNAPRNYPNVYRPHYTRLMAFYEGRDHWLESIAGVPEGAIHLFCVHWLHLEVFNGGFWQYFFNSTGVTAPEARAGFAAMGMPAVADIVGLAMDRVGTPFPFDRSDRQARVGPPNARLDFLDLDGAFYELADTEKVLRRQPRFVAFAERYAQSLTAG